MSQQIAQGAKARGLDPDAVLAVSSREGLSGKVGDGGTSFGPFQLHGGNTPDDATTRGALPQEIWDKGATYAQQWAMSPAGINYALDHIAPVAKGLKGSQAVVAIVTRFERPKYPAPEIAGAEGALGEPVSAPAAVGGAVTSHDSSGPTATGETASLPTAQQIAALQPLQMPGYAAVKGIAPKVATHRSQRPTIVPGPKFASSAFLAGLPKGKK